MDAADESAVVAADTDDGVRTPPTKRQRTSPPAQRGDDVVTFHKDDPVKKHAEAVDIAVRCGRLVRGDSVIETPTLVIPLRRGAVAHLTWDMLRRTLENGHNESLLLSAPLLDVVDLLTPLIRSAGFDRLPSLRPFFGIDADRHVLHVQCHGADAWNPVPACSSTQSALVGEAQTGRKSVLIPEEFSKIMPRIRPDLVSLPRELFASKRSDLRTEQWCRLVRKECEPLTMNWLEDVKEPFKLWDSAAFQAGEATSGTAILPEIVRLIGQGYDGIQSSALFILAEMGYFLEVPSADIEANDGRNFSQSIWRSIRDPRYESDQSTLHRRLSKYTKSYARHLFITHELLGPSLLTLVNLLTVLDFFSCCRKAIKEGKWMAFRSQFPSAVHTSESMA